jgi:hypothetical protein
LTLGDRPRRVPRGVLLAILFATAAMLQLVCIAAIPSKCQFDVTPNVDTSAKVYWKRGGGLLWDCVKYAPADYFQPLQAFAYGEGIDDFDRGLDGLPPQVNLPRSISSSVESATHGRVWRMGFPLRSFVGSLSLQSNPDYTWEMRPSRFTVCVKPESSSSLSGDGLVAFIEPLWLGLTVNVVVSTVLMLSVIWAWRRAVFVVRTRVSLSRRQRGVCEHCGYIALGLQTCPECGGIRHQVP